MKLIIDIPDDTYNKLMKYKEFYINTTIFSAITNGIPYNPVVDPCDMNMFEPDGAILGKGMLEE